LVIDESMEARMTASFRQSASTSERRCQEPSWWESGALDSSPPADSRPGRDEFLSDVLAGLAKPQKQLSPKYFYDDAGARLFEELCELDEYYIPRTEKSIMQAHVKEMTDLLGEDLLLIEYGCGDCAKTRIVLDHLSRPAGFVPIDISFEQLQRVAADLESSYPGLEVMPVCADYTGAYELPRPRRKSARNAVYFPGSTIGNFDPIPARMFLDHMAEACGPDGALLVGVDLKKDPAVLHRAYNDGDGVTAAFNLNLLARINAELGADVRLDAFEHYAFFNPVEGRVEMHLVSLADQPVHVDGITVDFSRGESIWTESSYKYSLDEFASLAAATGFRAERVWTDEREWFSVQYLVNDGRA
jgi:dimethylhistidine N-methyltransferase